MAQPYTLIYYSRIAPLYGHSFCAANTIDSILSVPGTENILSMLIQYSFLEVHNACAINIKLEIFTTLQEIITKF